MIRKTSAADFEQILAIINDAATAYRGVIPPDRWHEPYLSADNLHKEIKQGVVFYCYEEDQLSGVMGIQDKGEVALIRHAYVRTSCRRHGVGSALLRYLIDATDKPILIGTWAAATWAIRFYEKHGFCQVPYEEKERLLKRYWSIPARQIETSVVLADCRWSSTQIR